MKPKSLLEIQLKMPCPGPKMTNCVLIEFPGQKCPLFYRLGLENLVHEC